MCLSYDHFTGAPPIVAQITKLSSPATGGNYLVMVKLSEKSQVFPMGRLRPGVHIFKHTHARLREDELRRAGKEHSLVFINLLQAQNKSRNFTSELRITSK